MEPADTNDDVVVDSDTDAGGDTDTDTAPDTDPQLTDADGDGQTSAAGDCDDDDATVFRGADETQGDGVDSNCDGVDVENAFVAEALAMAHLKGEVTAPDVYPEAAGSTLKITPDATGDGFDDLVIVGPSGWYSDLREADPSETARVWLVGGTTHGDAALSDVAVTTWSGRPTDNYGSVVARGGDLDDDGLNDVVVSAISYDHSGGAAFVYLGGARGAQDYTDFSTAIVGAPNTWLWGMDGLDFDGDGRNERVATSTEGTFAFDAGLTGTVTTDDTDVYLPDRCSQGPFGRRKPDLDGDGYEDLFAADGTHIRFLAGPFATSVAPPALFTLEAAPYGSWQFSVGDVDGDGVLDLAYGSSLDSSNEDRAGRVTLYRGPLTGSRAYQDADAVLDAEHGHVGLGSGLSIAGDLNGDGDDEIVVGAPNGGNGAVVIFIDLWAGAHTTADANLALGGLVPYSAFGMTLATDGDLDGDGMDDLVVGAHGESDFAGAVWTFSGASLLP